MLLPQAVQYCIHALEAAGFEAYAVGGCVRDSLLGLTPADYDLCTNARPEETARVFSAHQLLYHGQKHGTIGVVLDGVVYEITTFRTEGGYDDARHPDWVNFVGTVEEDLARRDFTVNAMAYNPKTGYVDPFGGQADLASKLLRTVGDPRARFREDALRILRGARFSARFRLAPEPSTLVAMIDLAPLLDKIARERVFEELCKLLLSATAEDLLIFTPLLTQVIPELKRSVGFEQHSPHHRYDVFTHTAHVVEAVPKVPELRWAALLHDIGKPDAFTMDETGRGHFKGHAKFSQEQADSILLRLKAPSALRQQVTELIGLHMTPLEPDKKLLRRRLGKLGTERLEQLLLLQEADMGSKGTGKPENMEQFTVLREMIAEILQESACFSIKDLAVNGWDLQKIGIPAGPAIGKCLQWLLGQVQDEVLPNDRDALLETVTKLLEDRE